MNAWRSLLEKAWARRAFDAHTNAFRWCNAEGDLLPNVTIDWFDRVSVLSLYAPFTAEQEGQLVSAMERVAASRAIYIKRRPPEARESAKQLLEQLAPITPLGGTPVPECTVVENGLTYLIRPPNGLSVGLYLDARDARQWVAHHARDKTVLNLFAYTCGFGVCAIAGGARRAVNVDVSRKVLDWGEENARLNGQSVSRTDFIAGDVFEWLRRFRKKQAQFDLVILDPPSFATTRHSRFSAAKDYSRLVSEVAPVVAPGGTLLACCNLATLSRARFHRQLMEGLTRAGRTGRPLDPLGASTLDFPTPPGQEGALKVLPVELR